MVEHGLFPDLVPTVDIAVLLFRWLSPEDGEWKPIEQGVPSLIATVAVGLIPRLLVLSASSVDSCAVRFARSEHRSAVIGGDDKEDADFFEFSSDRFAARDASAAPR